MNNCKATFHKSGYFGIPADAANFSLIIKTEEGLNAHIQNIINQWKTDTAVTPEGYWESQAQTVKEFYHRYDKAFFKNKTLVIALADSGSGSYKHELINLCANKSGVLDIHIKRKAGTVMTMDYVRWVLVLEPDKKHFDITDTKIHLTCGTTK